MGYEIAEQLGWQVPDVILYPAGGGVGLIGIHKAMLEMRELGWIGERLPRLVAVQADRLPADRATRSRPGSTRATLLEGTHTLAFGINVPKALGDFLVLRGVRETDGTAIAVSDEAILAELGTLAAAEGTWICPEGAACLAAARQLRERGWIAEARAGRRAQHRRRPEVPRDRRGRRSHPRRRCADPGPAINSRPRTQFWAAGKWCERPS